MRVLDANGNEVNFSSINTEEPQVYRRSENLIDDVRADEDDLRKNGFMIDDDEDEDAAEDSDDEEYYEEDAISSDEERDSDDNWIKEKGLING